MNPYKDADHGLVCICAPLSVKDWIKCAVEALEVEAWALSVVKKKKPQLREIILFVIKVVLVTIPGVCVSSLGWCPLFN